MSNNVNEIKIGIEIKKEIVEFYNSFGVNYTEDICAFSQLFDYFCPYPEATDYALANIVKDFKLLDGVEAGPYPSEVIKDSIEKGTFENFGPAERDRTFAEFDEYYNYLKKYGKTAKNLSKEATKDIKAIKKNLDNMLKDNSSNAEVNEEFKKIKYAKLAHMVESLKAIETFSNFAERTIKEIENLGKEEYIDRFILSIYNQQKNKSNKKRKK